MNDKNIQIVRLISGEELIAEVIYDSTGKELHLVNPLILMAVPDQQNQGAVHLVPQQWIPYSAVAEEGIDIPTRSILFIIKPGSKLVDMHKRVFSKILTPATPSLIINQ